MTERDAPEDLDGSLVRGLVWTGVAKWGTQVVQWGATLLVARILAPADYGLVGMATLYLGLVTTISELGLTAGVLRHRTLETDQLRQLQALSTMLGVAAFTLSLGVARPLAAWFEAPALAVVVVALSAKFVISGLCIVPFALLQRRLAYGRIAAIETSQGLITSGVMVACALAGLSYWSLVIGNLTGVVVRAVLMLFAAPVGYRSPRLAELRDVMSFSAHVLGARLLWYTYSNADFLVVGKVLGSGPLGAYSLGWDIASMPVSKVTALVGQVTPGIFSAAQSDFAALRRYLLGLTEALAVVTFPAAVGIALVAPDLVRVVLGEKWEGAVVALQLLALYIPLRSVVPVVGQMLNMLGDSRLGMWNAVLQVAVLPPGFYVGSRWGLAGVATAWLVLYPLTVIPTYTRVFRRIALPSLSYFAVLRTGAIGVAGLLVVVLLVRGALPDSASGLGRLTATVLAGAVGYAAALSLFCRPRVMAMVALLRSSLGRP